MDIYLGTLIKCSQLDVSTGVRYHKINQARTTCKSLFPNEGQSLRERDVFQCSTP